MSQATAETVPRSIRANDFADQWREIREDALAAVERVGNSGWLILGKEVESFERELAAWWGVPHAVGVASGTDALEIALRCCGVGRGTRVLTTPLSAFATTLAILRAGAQPVWCDVDERGGLDLDRAARALRADSSIAAVVPVHLYGHPLDPCRLEALQENYGVSVIEDCAQAAGAEREGRPTGLAGVVGAVSLYPAKNLGALGDGGVLLTADAGVTERARRMRDYGQSARYEHCEPGLNSRLDELHAAILRSAMLPRIERWLERRREIAERYTQALVGSELRPLLAAAGRSSHHLYPVELIGADPAGTAQRLLDLGVPVARHYPFLAPDQPAAAGAGIVVGSLSNARRLCEREISLPIHPYLSDEQVEQVIEACARAAM